MQVLMMHTQVPQLHAHAVCAPLQVCRCLPFIHRIHQVDEVVTLAELRRIIKAQFLQYKDVKDPRVRTMRRRRPCMGLAVPDMTP